MFHGTTVDELMQMVEYAERHAQAVQAAEAHELDLAVVAYKSSEQEALAGVA